MTIFRLIFVLFLCLGFNAFAQPAGQGERFPKVEIDKTEVRELTSRANGQTYRIYVKFPRNYPNSASDYPVLYVLDAETNFGAVSYIVQRLIKDKLVPELLLIGIAYGVDYDTFYQLRSRDLTPTVRKDFKTNGVVNPTGGATKFARFIKDELFPFVTDNYRTRNEDRAVYGHSFGGLFAMYIFLNETLMFDKYLILSPSLWWDNKTLFHDINKLQSASPSGRCYIASGALELNIDDDQREFDRLLAGLSSPDLHIRTEILENETHRTIFGNGFTRGLRYLYAKTMQDQRGPDG